MSTLNAFALKETDFLVSFQRIDVDEVFDFRYNMYHAHGGHLANLCNIVF